MKIENFDRYCNLLEEILNNVRALKQSAAVLLNDEINNKRTKKQFQAIHAQYFLYICIEELGKFILIFKSYPKNFDSLKQLYKTTRWHDEKIGLLVKHIKEVNLKRGVIREYPVEGAIKILRGFKELNIYVDFENGSIVSPISNRGKDTLQNLTKIVTGGIRIAEIEFDNFKI